MTPETLERVGRALYGPLWQTQLSRTLGVNDRTVRRWLSGDMQIPEAVPDELRRLIREKRLELQFVAGVLE